MPDQDTLRDDIVDTAIALGERGGWGTARLHDVATELGIPLDDIRGHFREKEDIVDAGFDRADAAMQTKGSASCPSGKPDQNRTSSSLQNLPSEVLCSTAQDQTL